LKLRMWVGRPIHAFLSAILLMPSLVWCDLAPIVAHKDPIEVDANLSLAALIQMTLEKYPDTYWLNALEEEAGAIKQRSESWLAGPPKLGLAYQGASSGTLHYADAVLQAPIWNFGQRDAEQVLAQQSRKSAGLQKDLIQLRIAGLVRDALWDMALSNIRYDQALSEYQISERLVQKIKKLFELGELPRADLLLVKSESLSKRSKLTQAEAEVMHARRRYQSITQSTKIPGKFTEQLAPLTEIEQSHPALLAINGLVARKQAEIEAIRQTGSGQTQLTLGVNSDRGDFRSNDTESVVVAIDIPFGGSAHLAPKIAKAHVQLNKLIARRELLRRELEQAHHEAEHSLQVNRVELATAEEIKQLAERHMKMTELSLSAGEIDLIDYLKIQSRTEHAVSNAKQRSVTLQRDIAFYNQSVGVLP